MVDACAYLQQLCRSFSPSGSRRRIADPRSSSIRMIRPDIPTPARTRKSNRSRRLESMRPKKPDRRRHLIAIVRMARRVPNRWNVVPSLGNARIRRTSIAPGRPSIVRETCADDVQLWIADSPRLSRQQTIEPAAKPITPADQRMTPVKARSNQSARRRHQNLLGSDRGSATNLYRICPISIDPDHRAILRKP